MSDMKVLAIIINIMAPALSAIAACGRTPQTLLSLLIVFPLAVYVIIMYLIYIITNKALAQYRDRELTLEESRVYKTMREDRYVWFAYVNTIVAIIAVISQFVGSAIFSWSGFMMNAGTFSVGFSLIVMSLGGIAIWLLRL